jgi:hypothetical protein
MIGQESALLTLAGYEAICKNNCMILNSASEQESGGEVGRSVAGQAYLTLTAKPNLPLGEPPPIRNLAA